MSCLFVAVGSIIGVPANRLRHEVCEELSTLESVSGIPKRVALGRNPDKYIASMRSEETWGSAVEVAVMADMYNICVYIRSIRSQDDNKVITFQPFATKSQRPLSHVYLTWNGGHYTCDPAMGSTTV